MAFIKATESRFNQTVQKDQATLIAELISRVTSLLYPLYNSASYCPNCGAKMERSE